MSAVEAEIELLENLFHIVRRDVDAEETVDPVGMERQAVVFIVGVIDVDEAADDLARAEHLDEFAGPLDGGRHIRESSSFSKRPELSVRMPSLLRGFAHGGAEEIRGFKDDGFGVVLNAAVFAAHHAGDAGGLLFIADHEHFGRELALHAVERLDRFALPALRTTILCPLRYL